MALLDLWRGEEGHEFDELSFHGATSQLKYAWAV